MGRLGLIMLLAVGAAVLGATSRGYAVAMPEPVSVATLGAILFCLSMIRIRR